MGEAAINWITLAIAVWGAGLSSLLAVSKRRRKVRVAAGFGTARLGPLRNHSFFIVTVTNTGERQVTVNRVEWVSASVSAELEVFRHSKGQDLPVKVEADGEVRILFDVGVASRMLVGTALGERPSRIRICLSGTDQTKQISITEEMRVEAEEENERQEEGKP